MKSLIEKIMLTEKEKRENGITETLHIKKVSDIQEISNLVDQQITFVGGIKLSYRGIISGSAEQGIFTHLKMKDGRTIMINPSNVLAIEITKHE